jgi:hypothetical protein
MLGRIWVILVLSLTAAAPTFASTFFATGTFTADDQVQYFSLNLGAPAAITLQTFGYAGNAGLSVAAGGFDPELSLFRASGTFITYNDDAGCPTVTADPVTGNCWDAKIVTGTLAAGTYFVALTESNNDPNGPTLADGFTRVGQGNYTCSEFFPPHTGPFCDVSPAVRNGHWAFQVTGVTAAVSGLVPEPSSFVLAAFGIFVLFQIRGRRMYR